MKVTINQIVMHLNSRIHELEKKEVVQESEIKQNINSSQRPKMERKLREIQQMKMMNENLLKQMGA